MSRSFCWAENKEFVAWLHREFAYTELEELEDDVISLMYLAWLAGHEDESIARMESCHPNND